MKTIYYEYVHIAFYILALTLIIHAGFSIEFYFGFGICFAVISGLFITWLISHFITQKIPEKIKWLIFFVVFLLITIISSSHIIIWYIYNLKEGGTKVSKVVHDAEGYLIPYCGQTCGLDLFSGKYKYIETGSLSTRVYVTKEKSEFITFPFYRTKGYHRFYLAPIGDKNCVIYYKKQRYSKKFLSLYNNTFKYKDRYCIAMEKATHILSQYKVNFGMSGFDIGTIEVGSPTKVTIDTDTFSLGSPTKVTINIGAFSLSRYLNLNSFNIDIISLKNNEKLLQYKRITLLRYQFVLTGMMYHEFFSKENSKGGRHVDDDDFISTARFIHYTLRH